MDRAYSILEIKATRDDERVIEGIASTPAPDRMGDVVEPMGAVYKLPMPLLWQHNHNQPVGHVEFAKPTKNGIPFKARFTDPSSLPDGPLKQRLEEAWQSVKIGLVRAVSIGFRPIGKPARLENGGLHFRKWEWLELSAVTIPAQAEATITTVKSIDRRQVAALGREPRQTSGVMPGASGKSSTTSKGNQAMKAFHEQIADLEARRAEISAEMKSFGDVTELDDEQASEFDDLAAQLENNQKSLARLKALQLAAGEAKSVKAATPRDAVQSRLTIPAQVKAPELPKGTAFARYALAVAAGKGSISDTLAYAKRYDDQTPEVSAFIKATAGTVADVSPGWGSELAQPQNLASEFIDLLRPATILGRIQGLRRVPFNVTIPGQNTSSNVNWVGETARKPVSDLGFESMTIGVNKIAGIVAISDELVRLSNPAAEELVRRDLIESIGAFTDLQFIDPAITANATRPASITNGITPTTASGTDETALAMDLNAALATLNENIDLTSVVLVMNSGLARGIASLRNALGQKSFPEMTANGGSIDGFPVIVSNSAGSGQITIIVASEVLLADDGGVRLEASNQASLDMDGNGTIDTSLWQQNLIAIRAERWITWRRRRSNSVALITGAQYGPTVTSP